MFDSRLFDIPDMLISRHGKNSRNTEDYRNEFMRDRDRILYSGAFRRLNNKTQIYTTGNDDFKRNRLTHSLEVSQIARTICHALGLNEDLAEAISFGHDIGHTPFGHKGEEMLNEIMTPNSKWIKDSPFYNSLDKIKELSENCDIKNRNEYNCLDNVFGFKHNIQGLRLCAYLEDGYRDEANNSIGLNLTNYTLWGILNHSELYYNENDCFPNYQNMFLDSVQLCNEEKDAWSFEAYVVKLADTIAQWHHDFEDALRGKLLSLHNIKEFVEKSMWECIKPYDQKLLDRIDFSVLDHKCVTDLSHVFVNTLVTDAVETSTKNLSKIENEAMKIFNRNSFDTTDLPSVKLLSEQFYRDYETMGFSIARDKAISISEKIKDDQFKNIIRGAVHYSRQVESMNEKGRYIIRKLFSAYYSHPQQLPDGPILHYLNECGLINNIDDRYKYSAGEIRIIVSDKTIFA